MTGERFERRVRIRRPHDVHDLHLVELMLADHAARVLAGRARFRSEAWRVRHELQRQLLRRHDLLAHEIGDRHFRRRNEMEVALALDGEQVLLELRQLPGSEQRGGLHEIRHVHFGVAMLARMQVEHELAKRAVQPRDA